MRKLLLTILAIVIVVFIVQLLLALRDRKKNKDIPTNYSLLKALPIVLAVTGWFMYTLSWVEIPFTQGINFFNVLSGRVISTPSTFDEPFLVYGVLLFFTLGLMIWGAFFQLVFRISVRSIPSLVFEVLLGLGSTIIGLLTIEHIRHILDQPKNMFGLEQLFQEMLPVSAGAGIIVLTSIGVIYAIFVVVQQRLQVVKLKKGNASPPAYDNLRELKKLLDEGVITQEEFDRKKTETLG